MIQAVTAQAGLCAETLAGKIAARSARVGIVGLGYVGLPLAVEFAKAGFSVTGIDRVQSREN
jgi:UDP-N-acetyl-D-glucosamine dehydrogenase